jgi:hypothetical protein
LRTTTTVAPATATTGPSAAFAGIGLEISATAADTAAVGPQRSTAAVVAAGFAVIAAVIVVVWVGLQPRGGTSSKASASPSASEVGMPATVDEKTVIQVLVVQNAVSSGTTLGAAIAAGLVSPTVVPAEIAPADSLSSSTADMGTVLGSDLSFGVILADSNVKASSPATPAPSTADCPKDWTGTVAADKRVVFIVTAPIGRGTTVAQAYSSGALRPYAVSAKWVSPTAAGTLAAVCHHVAAFDLTRGTPLTSGTFVAA